MKIKCVLRSVCTLCAINFFVQCFANKFTSATSSASSTQKITSRLDASTKAFKFSSGQSNFKGKAETSIPDAGFGSRLMFSWVKDLMKTGNSRKLELQDLFTMKLKMDNVSETFDKYLQHEIEISKNSREASKKNILLMLWASPVTKAIVKMYFSTFSYSALIRFFNTVIQFVPSLIIAKILKLAESSNASIASRHQGILLTLLLLLTLCIKTFLENQYFDSVITLGANVKGALSSAIYRKSLKLSPAGRQNNTVS